MVKRRTNLYLDIKTFKILKAIAKSSEHSMGELVDQLVFDNLSDPIHVLRSECKKLVQTLTYNQQKIKDLEEAEIKYNEENDEAII